MRIGAGFVAFFLLSRSDGEICLAAGVEGLQCHGYSDGECTPVGGMWLGVSQNGLPDVNVGLLVCKFSSVYQNCRQNGCLDGC